MRQMFRNLLVVVAGILAISAVASAAASAATPELVNKAGAELTKKQFTFSSGRVSFHSAGNAFEIPCGTSSASGGLVEGTKNATATIKFKECGSEGEQCRDVGSQANEITYPIKSQLVEAQLADSEFTVAQLLTINGKVKFQCNGAKIIEMKGSLLCEFSRGLGTAHPLICEGNGSGKPRSTKYEETIGGPLKTAKLELSENGGKFYEASIEETSGLMSFEEEAQVK